MEKNKRKDRDVGADNPGIGHRAYAITVLCAAGVSTAYAAAVGVFTMKDAGVTLGYLSNAFTLPGVLLLGLSGLDFVKRQGGFDGLSYSTRYMSNWLLPQFWLNKEERSGNLQSYRDYCEDRRIREKGQRNMSKCFFLVGAAFTALGIFCLATMNIMFPGTILN